MEQKRPKARVLAYYLPQFHPIPENDEWWGKGFTEWTNVGKAKPLFPGHYQPHVPADLGYYDLRVPETREAQAQMAREAGVEGFVYWHYWFGNGKRLLERPFNEVLASGKPDFPFALAWANESWSGTLHGLVKGKTLIEQIYSEEDLKIINEDDNPLHWDKILYVLFLELIVIIDQLIEGSNRVPSFIGIKKCSFFYWFCFLVYVGIMLYFINYSIKKVYEHINIKKKLIPNFKSEVVANVENNITYVVGISIIAGIVSSSLGIGGGMITNPAFSSLGMDPKESSSTSNFLIIVTAIASSFIFILSGQLEIGYSICLGTFCTLAALVGSFYILKYINKTGKSSVLLVIMEYFLVASLFIAIYKIFTLDLNDTNFFGSLFMTNKFC